MDDNPNLNWWDIFNPEDYTISDDYINRLSEAWYGVIYPDMNKQDSADLINQMTLVSSDDAADLKEWYDK